MHSSQYRTDNLRKMHDKNCVVRLCYAEIYATCFNLIITYIKSVKSISEIYNGRGISFIYFVGEYKELYKKICLALKNDCI